MSRSCWNGWWAVIAGAVLVICPPVLAATDFGEWTKIFELPVRSPTLNAVAFGNGRFVAVGDGHAPHISMDGVTWKDCAQGDFKDLAITGLVFGQGQFVAVGRRFSAGGIISLVSSDGEVWKEASINTDGNLDLQSPLLTHGNGVFLWKGRSGQTGDHFITSTDGIHWTSKAGPPNRVLAFGKGKFVILSPTGFMFTSADGLLWKNEANLPWPLFPTGLAYGNGRFVAIGLERNVQASTAATTSTDGFTWTEPVPVSAGPVHGATYAGSRFVAASGSLTFVSTDGLSWSESALDSEFPITGFAGNDKRIVAIGIDGSIWSSGDGLDWARRARGASRLGLTQALNTETHDYLFARNSQTLGARSFVATSHADGWTLEESAFGFVEQVVRYRDQFYGLTDFLRTVSTSRDGTTWFPAYLPPGREIRLLFVDSQRSLLRAYFFEAGKVIVSTTSDGENWQSQPSEGLPVGLSAMTSGKDLFVAIGTSPSPQGPGRYNSHILSSADGVHWTPRATRAPDAGLFTALTYGTAGFLVAVQIETPSGSRKDLFLRSSDGIAWSEITPPLTPRALAFGHGWYVATGEGRKPGEQPAIWASADGVAWKRQLTGGGWTRIYFGNRRFTALKNTEAWQSPNVVPPFSVSAVLEDNRVRIQRTSKAGLEVDLAVNYSIERALPDGKIEREIGLKFIIPAAQTSGILATLATGGVWQTIRLEPDDTYLIGADSKVTLPLNAAPADPGLPTIQSLRRHSDGTVSLNIATTIASGPLVQTSENLHDWITLISVPAPATGEVKDPAARDKPHRFYKVRPR